MSIDKLIGNTPMIKIRLEYDKKIINVYAKLEFYNYTGSIKDRLANYIIRNSYLNGTLKNKMPIVEATSGNTGIAFAALGAYYGHPVHIFMPDWVSEERINIMRLYGARVYLISREDGGFQEAIRQADLLAESINGFRPDQFSNELNVKTHYDTTGKEIVEKIPNIDAFISGIGTGGTLMGISTKIKEFHKDVEIIAMEPKQLPILSTGSVDGSHKIEGVGDDFIPPIVDKSIIDKIITIDDEDAINMSRILARKFGLGVGISSGANLIASALSKKENVVTIFADDLKKYLSTDLTNDINVDNTLISNNINILSIEYI